LLYEGLRESNDLQRPCVAQCRTAVKIAGLSEHESISRRCNVRSTAPVNRAARNCTGDCERLVKLPATGRSSVDVDDLNIEEIRDGPIAVAPPAATANRIALVVDEHDATLVARRVRH
jgi:hypothetical protein